MDIIISENIRKLRKERSMTQEQLAEILGVTVGAVYKWENGRSMPELNMLIDMADLFGISIDALLGYKVRNNNREHTIERLKACMHNRDDANEVSEAERALKKYPNDFEIVYQCAQLFDVKGTENGEKKYLQKALELFQHAILLIHQNTNENITELDIQIQIAEIYYELNKTQKAIEILQKNNSHRINSASIGVMLAVEGKQQEEACAYLSEALLDCIVNQVKITMGYLNIYLKKKQWEEAIDILQWELDSIQKLKVTNKTNFLEKTEALFWLICGEMYLYLGKEERALECMRRAKITAKLFDADPSYDTDRIRFIIAQKESKSAHDNMGVSAMEALCQYVKEEKNTAFTDMWEVILNEAE